MSRKRSTPAARWGRYLLAVLVASGISAQLFATSDTPHNSSPEDAHRTLYAHGDRLRPLVEATGSAQTLNIYGPGGRIIVQVVADGQEVRHLLPDHLGSTRAALEGEGNTLAHFEYGPHGETAVTGTGAELRYRYTGHPYDEEQGLYQTPARGYDPATGRFLSVDPQRQDASPYVYAGNNPVGFLDSTGGVEVPFFMYTGFEAKELGGRRISYKARALGLEFGMVPMSTQEVYPAAIFDPAGRVSDAERYTQLMIVGQKNARGEYKRGYAYNDRMYLFVGDEANVDRMSRLKQGVEAFRKYRPEFARKVTIINFAQDKTNAENIRDRLEGMGMDIDPLLLDARIEGDTVGISGGKRFNLKNVAVGKDLYTPQAFVEHVHKVEAAGKPIPVVTTPDRGPTRLGNGGGEPSNLIELTPGERTLQIGMPMERGVGMFTYEGVD